MTSIRSNRSINTSKSPTKISGSPTQKHIGSPVHTLGSLFFRKGLGESFNTGDVDDLDDWSDPLPLGGLLLNLSHHVHAFDHASKGSKPLTVGITRAAEVQRRLVADANEELRSARSSEP